MTDGLDAWACAAGGFQFQSTFGGFGAGFF
jgi:hypothetical protein